MYRILFICTGNICRTPMAESLLRERIYREGLQEHIQVDSAGTWANENLPATALSLQVLEEHGLDGSFHRSKHVDSRLIQSADLVLCMAVHHKRDLQSIFPQHSQKIFTLREFARQDLPEELSIDDPIGRNIDYYRRIFQAIQREINRIWPEIKRRALSKEKAG